MWREEPLDKTIASVTHSAAAQEAATKLTKLHLAVLKNRYIADEVWPQAFKGKLRVTSAQAAVRRMMSEPQMLHVIDTDTRSQVLSTMLASSAPTQAVLDRITDRIDDGLADTLASNWGQQMPVEWLRTLPAPIPGRLRIWWLLRDSDLSDDQVLTELDAFDQWGVGYDQPVVAWILANRPAMFPQAAHSASLNVRTQVAASHLFGSLTAEEQRHALFLDQRPDKSSEEHLSWHNERAYMWMAAGGNPTLHLELLKDLERALNAQDVSYGAARNIKNRAKYRAWRVESFQGATDPTHLAALVQHVALGGKKEGGRPHSLPALADNPALSWDDVEQLTLMCARVANPPRMWTLPQVRQALERIEARFPDEPTALTDWWAYAAATHGVIASTPVQWYKVEGSEQRLAKAGERAQSQAPESLAYDEDMLRWLEIQVGENTQAWLVIYQLLETFEGTVAELAVVAGAAA